jgi:hypothetical protein
MGPERVVSIAMGDVDWLPKSENVLVAYGALLDPEFLGQMRWEAQSRQQFSQWMIKDEAPMGWTLFGAERLPGVGP